MIGIDIDCWHHIYIGHILICLGIEWVSKCYLTPIQQFFQLYHGENKLIFNEMMMMSALLQTNTLKCFFFIVLAHWNNSQRVGMSLHSDTLFWFRANQSLLLLLNALRDRHLLLEGVICFPLCQFIYSCRTKNFIFFHDLFFLFQIVLKIIVENWTSD